ncbi:MAG: GGDEF domain-containing protein [Ruminococcus sp.]|nr:GGDEF domain-containing protein [Ruminococcus sp.]
MNGRKKICVIMCDLHHPYQQEVMKGIIMQAHHMDYDVAVFTKFMNIDEENEYQYGENRIFSLLDYSLFDGVIHAPCSIGKRALREHFVKDLAENCRVPVVALEIEHDEYKTVSVDDASAFEQLVSHLIEHHNASDILCLTGFAGNLQAEERLQGYRNAMIKHGLPLREDRMIYGDFWKEGALNLAQSIADGTIEKPQAIVCASDFVAITLTNRLVELGFRVPDDILVTGFDNSQDAEENIPSITSYARPLLDLGMRAVAALHEEITGECALLVENNKGYLVPAESCGCGISFIQKFQKRKNVDKYNSHRNLFYTSHMAESLNSAPTINRLLEKICTFLYLNNNMKDFYLCLNDQWDDISRNDTEGSEYMEYTDTMRLRIQCRDEQIMIVDEPFEKKIILPALYEECDHPRTLYFTPLHFNERCFGYCAMGYGTAPQAFDEVYHSWIRNINNALEFVRVRNIFNVMSQRLYMASIRDALTGLYNRKGFDQFSEECYEKARQTGKKLLVIAADLDCLKPINDNYGHLEGDKAIVAAANALNSCFETDAICARVGGDEFFLIGCADYEDDVAAHYEQHVAKSLDHYNKRSGKPYPVEVSIGCLCRPVTEEDTLQNMLDEADIMMYASKVRRRKNRR